MFLFFIHIYKEVIFLDKNMDYNNFNGFYGYSPYPPYENFDPTMGDVFNPIMQYEQGYMYYRYLTQQLDYKIKCKEYEKLYSKENRSERRVE